MPQALEMLKQALPPQAVLVGQGINHDVQWLNLREGVDFQVHYVPPASHTFLLAEVHHLCGERRGTL